MSRFVYFTRETWISLRRNLLMTLAGIMTVAVSLFAVRRDPAWCRRLVDHGTSQWKHGVELEIFMNVDAHRPADRRGEVRARRSIKNDQVQQLPLPQQGGRVPEFKRIFADQPALVESTTPDALPDVVPGRARRRRS